MNWDLDLAQMNGFYSKNKLTFNHFLTETTAYFIIFIFYSLYYFTYVSNYTQYMKCEHSQTVTGSG